MEWANGVKYGCVSRIFACRCKKYPSMELQGLVQYLVNQLKRGEGIELILLQVLHCEKCMTKTCDIEVSPDLHVAAASHIFVIVNTCALTWLIG